jgi:putative membrane protein
MRRWLGPLIAVPFLVTPAFGQSIGEKTGVNSVIGVAPSTSDFVTLVVNSDLFELESSRLAETKGDQPAKSFASHMIKDHTKTSEELKAMASSGKVEVPLPAKMDETHQKKVDRLASLSADEFSKQYKSDQVTAHKEAVSLFQRYAESGDNPNLKEWAGKTVPVLQEHLKMAEEMK